MRCSISRRFLVAEFESESKIFLTRQVFEKIKAKSVKKNGFLVMFNLKFFQNPRCLELPCGLKLNLILQGGYHKPI